jgi:hypothetical protein
MRLIDRASSAVGLRSSARPGTKPTKSVGDYSSAAKMSTQWLDQPSAAFLIRAVRAAVRLAAYLGPLVVGRVPDVTRALSQFLLSAPGWLRRSASTGGRLWTRDVWRGRRQLDRRSRRQEARTRLNTGPRYRARQRGRGGHGHRPHLDLLGECRCWKQPNKRGKTYYHSSRSDHGALAVCSIDDRATIKL